MRRRLSRSHRWFILLLCFALTHGARLAAQTGLTPEAFQFLLPIGARSLGQGQAVVAGGSGVEAINWNPGLVSRGPREFAFNLAEQANGIAATDADVAILWPVPRVGAFAITLRYIAEQDQQSVNDEGRLVGTFNLNSFIGAATFAAPFGARLAAGLTLKFLQQGASCTGSCDLPAFPPRTAGIDAGVQYFLMKDSTVTVGASLLNAGLPLQVNDSPQADPLPTRAIVGVSVAPRLSNAPKELGVRGEADIIKRVSGGGPGYRLGGELSWQNEYIARIGYQLYSYTPTVSGFTVGVGLATGKLRIDFAQVFTDLGVGSGKPTYLSLRYVF
jgi:hypothetical protein